MISYMVVQLIFFIGIITLFIVVLRLLKAKFLNHKRNQWLLIGYLVILIAALPIVYLLPINENNSDKNVTLTGDGKIPNLYVIPQMTGSIELAKDYLIDQWTFDYRETELNIEITGEDYLTNIAIEKTEDLSNTIEAELYVTPNIIKNIALPTENIPATRAKLQGDNLVVQTPDRVEIGVAQVQNEFPIRQFTDPDYLDNIEWGTGTGVNEEVVVNSDDEQYVKEEDNRLFSTELLYIRVPIDIEIQPNEELNIFFVDED